MSLYFVVHCHLHSYSVPQSRGCIAMRNKVARGPSKHGQIHEFVILNNTSK